jgi:hypothetical protein
MNSELLRSKALRCRELAEAASDAEVAVELLHIANDIETALLLLGNQRSASIPLAGSKERADREAVPGD